MNRCVRSGNKCCQFVVNVLFPRKAARHICVCESCEIEVQFYDHWQTYGIYSGIRYSYPQWMSQIYTPFLCLSASYLALRNTVIVTESYIDLLPVTRCGVSTLVWNKEKKWVVPEWQYILKPRVELDFEPMKTTTYIWRNWKSFAYWEML